MRALVTGSSGFVGRHMVAELERQGYRVTTVDIVSGGRDCLHYFELDTTPLDLVVHCAANVGGRKAIDNQPLWVAQNLGIDAAMFDWAVRTKQPRVVYYSSSAAYPVDYQTHAEGMWLDEADIDFGRKAWLPDGTYGWAKLTGERLAREAEAAGVRVHIFRPFSGYGDDQSADYPFGAFRDRALHHADPFDIWGDGTAVRDWIHIDDLIAATLAAVDQDYDQPLNLCTGIGTTFDELARLFTRAADYDPVLRRHLDGPTGVQYRVGDPTNMHKVYTPKISIEEGVYRATHTGASHDRAAR